MTAEGKFSSHCHPSTPQLNPYSYVKLDAWVIMPNHLHGIIMRTDEIHMTDLSFRIKRKSLGRLVGAFKTVCTKHINIIRNSPSAILWQRDFYDRINRSERSLECIRQYILNNPFRWSEDPENPDNQLTNQESLRNLPFSDLPF